MQNVQRVQPQSSATTPTLDDARAAVERGGKLPSGWSKEDHENWSDAMMSILVLGTVTLAQNLKRDELGMSKRRAKSFSDPVIRIALRHMPKIGKSGDFADAGAIVFASGMYAMEISIAARERAQEARERKDADRNGVYRPDLVAPPTPTPSATSAAERWWNEQSQARNGGSE